MHRSTFRALLLCGAALGAFGLASPASAATIGGGGGSSTPPEFQVIEQCIVTTGCSGTFTVINNSDNAAYSPVYIWGFDVGNPNASADGTTQNNWAASLNCGSSCGNQGFEYENTNLSSLTDLTDDIGPGQTSNLFTFTALAPNSPIVLSLVDSEGNVTTADITSDVPEPTSLAVLGSGLVGLFGFNRRRRTRAKV
jgi:hypothetical protein